MAKPVFIDYSPETPITAKWLNDVSTVIYGLFGGTSQIAPTDVQQLVGALPLELVLPNVATLRLVSKLTNSLAFLTANSVVGDGGEGHYQLDPTDLVSADNGGSIIVGVDGGRWKLQHMGVVSVRQFGARDSETVDNTTALQNAYTWGASVGALITHPDGNYNSIGGLTAACALDFSPNAKLNYTGAPNGTLLQITANNLQHGEVNVWGNSTDVLALYITGSGNSFKGLTSGGVTASVSAAANVNGIHISGTNNRIRNVEVTDMVNTGYANESYPQSMTVDGDGNIIEEIVFENGRSGLILSAAVTLTVGNITCRNMADNGIYQLLGILRLGHLEYQGNEEPVVFKGDADVNSITIIGTAFGVGFQDCGDVRIGELSVRPDSAGNTALFLWRVRNTSVSCGRISIGRVTGKYTGSSLFSMPSSTAGTVEYLDIGSMDVKFLYDTSVAISTSSFADLTAVKGFRWSNSLVEIIDVNNVGSVGFICNAPTTVQKESFIDRVDFVCYASDQVTENSNTVHCVNFAQTLVEATRVHWRTDIGPYIVNTSSTGSLYDCVTQAPTAGTWKRGKSFESAFPALGGPKGWRCIAAGTPGTWQVSGQNGIFKSDSTNRPTATTMGVANDASWAGTQYLDTTLSGNGKLITWSGTQWVDATGAGV